MRLLLVNPNTTAAITATLAAAAGRRAAGRATITAVTAPFGRPALQTPEDCAAAIPAVVAAVAANPGFDAGIVAAFADPGMAEAQAIAGFPLVGLASEGMKAAGAGGRRFAIVTLGPALRPVLEARIAALGLASQLTEIHFLEAGVLQVAADRAAFHDQLAAATAACAGRGALAVLFGGAPFAGVADEIRHRVALPVLDGLDAAVDAAIARA